MSLTEVASSLIPVGPKAAIELATKDRLLTTIRGVCEREYILIDPPVKEGSHVLLQDEEVCVMRFVHDGEVMGFKTTVMGSTYHPIRAVFLHYPTAIEKRSLRKDQRYPLRIPCTYLMEKGKCPATINDISRQGCGLLVRDPLEKGELLYLTFTLPTGVQVVAIAAEIRSVTKKEEEYQLGMFFPDPHEYVVEFISLFLQSD